VPEDGAPEDSDDAFRARARAFLETHARRRRVGDDDFARFRFLGDPSADADAEHVRRCKEWQRTLFDSGWAGIAWPKEYGGLGATPAQARIFAREQARFDVEAGAFAVGIGMVGPTLIAHGTEAQKARYLPALLRGDEVWCQLFSEPGAGSDLAGLRTRAVRDGDEWVISGQKVWSSGAHHSELGILLARTEPDAPKHQGITYFILDMDSAGIEVRPLRQINGVAHFNEVFLTDVRIPHENVVGDVNGGWAVAHTTLGAERVLIGSGGAVGFRDLARLAREQDRTGDVVLRQRLADAYIRFEILKYLGQRAQAARPNGAAVGAEASVLKLAVSRNVALNGDLALALEGATGMLLHEDAPYGGFWQQQFLNQWGTRIGGGTEQVQRNVIGERVLGLPPEPRPDKRVPFRELAGS
jgi:alkylation response protein AidB-like acyl-CoA dehydrogenase